jgi:hypothetical protein
MASIDDDRDTAVTLTKELGVDPVVTEEGDFAFELSDYNPAECGLEFSGCHFPGLSALFVTKVDETTYPGKIDGSLQSIQILKGDEVIGVGGEAIYPGTDNKMLQQMIAATQISRKKKGIVRPLKLNLRRRALSSPTSEPMEDSAYMHYLCKAYPQEEKSAGCAYAYGLDTRLVLRAKNHLTAMHYHMADDNEVLRQKLNWMKASSEGGGRFGKTPVAFGTKLHRLKLHRDFLATKLRLQNEKHRIQDELHRLGEMPLHGPDCEPEKEENYEKLKQVELALLKLLEARESQMHIQNDFDNAEQVATFREHEKQQAAQLKAQEERHEAKFIADHRALKKEVEVLEMQQQFTSETIKQMKKTIYLKEMELDGAIRMNPAVAKGSGKKGSVKGRDLFPDFSNFWIKFPSTAPPGAAEKPKGKAPMSPINHTPKQTTRVQGKKI